MKYFGMILAGSLLAATAASASIAAEATGTWRMESGKFTVRVSKCGAGLCGVLVALKKPRRKDGSLKTDSENPNPALRNRSLIGVTLFSGLRPSGANTWKGSIYNPDDGRTYAASLKLDGNRMRVKGCVVGFLCQSSWFVRLN